MISWNKEPDNFLYVIRDAETKLQSSNQMMDVGASLENLEPEANPIGKLLQDVRFTRAFSSGHLQAYKTGLRILSASRVSSGVKLQIDKKLRDMTTSLLSNTQVEFESSMNDDDNDDETASFLNRKMGHTGVSREEIDSRIESFLQHILSIVDRSKKPETIMVVTQAITCLYFFQYLFDTNEKYLCEDWLPEYYLKNQTMGYFKIAIQKNPYPNEPRTMQIVDARVNDGPFGLRPDANTGTGSTLMLGSRGQNSCCSFL